MLKEHKNPKVKGTVGLGHAISYFTRIGTVVALPLNDSQPYDLIVEIDGELKKVQVKTSTSDSIALRTMGGNQSYHTAKLFEHTSCDYFSLDEIKIDETTPELYELIKKVLS